jgi:prepilin-type processing-associated H-X9-DG protein
MACQNNLRQIGLALHHHHGGSRAFPPGARGANDRFPYLAWSARLLPYLDQSAAWGQTTRDYQRQLHFAHPVPHVLLGQPLPSFLCPAGQRATAFLEWERFTVAFTYYLGVAGGERPDDGMLFFGRAVRIAHVKDGTSNTVLVGERPPSADSNLGWWYAGVGQRGDASADCILMARQWNYTFRAPMCPPGPYHFGPGRSDNQCDTFHFWSSHPGGANFLFADGSVRFLAYSADAVLPALATRSGGESVAIPE